MLPALPVSPSPDTRCLPAPQGSNSQGAPSRCSDQPASQPQAAEKSMPSSPEVWPPRVPDSTDPAREGAPGGDSEGNGCHSYGAQCLLRWPRGCRRARVSVSAPPHPPPPARATRHSAPPAEGRPGTLPQPTHALCSEALGGHRRRPLRGTERGEAGTPSSTPPSSHSSRPPLPPPEPHYAHRLAAAAALPSRAPTSGAAAGSAPSLQHRGPSTCRASPARVVTAP